MNFYGCFPMCVHVCEDRSFKRLNCRHEKRKFYVFEYMLFLPRKGPAFSPM